MKSKGENTKLKIIEATIECIAELGIEKASISAISARAHVSRGLVAHYFPKKNEIFLHLINYIVKNGLAEIEKEVGDSQGFEKIIRMASANLRFFISRPSYFRCFYLFYYYSSFSPAHRRLNTAFTLRAVKRIQNALHEEKKIRAARKSKIPGSLRIQSGALATALHDELVGAIQKYYVVQHRSDADQYIEQFTAQLKEKLELG